MYLSRNTRILINIGLCVVCVAVLIVCIAVIVSAKNKPIETKDVVLVKDMADVSEKVKSDVVEHVKENKGSEGGTVSLQVPVDEKGLTPEELFAQREEQGETNTVVEAEVTPEIPYSDVVIDEVTGEPITGIDWKEDNGENGEPLPMYPLDVPLDVIDTQLMEPTPMEPVDTEYINRQKERNEGRCYVGENFNLLAENGENVSIGSLIEKGLVVIYFEDLTEDTLGFIHKAERYYNKYKNDVAFVLLSSKADLTNNYEKVKADLDAYGIGVDYPLYLDKEGVFRYAVEEDDTAYSCVLINSDGYVVDNIVVGAEVEELKDKIANLIDEQKFIDEQDADRD